MIVALDYDGTIDADPELFRQLIALFRSRGHTPIVVTSRTAGFSDEVERTVGEVPVVYAGSVWKRQAAQAAGYMVNVWIDDCPEYIDLQDPEMVAFKCR